MSVSVRLIEDHQILNRAFDYLRNGGFNPYLDGQNLKLDSVGYGDKSVNLQIQVLEIEGHRILKFMADISDTNSTFELVSLAVVRGNSFGEVSRFVPIETDLDHDERFRVVASCHLYADYFSQEEICAMTYLFIKEVDEIDNELRAILSGF